MEKVSNDSVELSIILPVFNAEERIGACLEMLAKALDTKMELIIIDDGSGDGTKKVIKEFLGRNKDARIIFKEKKNGGVSSARNYGLNIAGGEYVGFMDVDDKVAAEMYSKLLDRAVKNDLDISGCNFYEIFGDKRVNSKYHYDDNLLSGKEAVSQYLLDKISNSVWDKIFRRGLISDIKFDESLVIGEDILFCLQAFMRVKKVGFLNDAWYGYVQNEASAMHSKLDKFKQYNLVIDELSDKERSELLDEYTEEFQFFKLEMELRTIHAISMATVNRKKRLSALKSILKNIDTRAIMENKKFPRSARIEMRLLKTFGPRFHLIMMPVYKMLRGAIR